MKKILLAAVLAISASAAKASEQVWVTIDSVTWSNVGISSSVATRVDNLNLGTTGVALNGRTHININIQKNQAPIVCEYYLASAVSVNLSSVAGSAFLGAQYTTTVTESRDISVMLPSSMSYWCMMGVVGSSTTIHVNQFRPVRALFGN